THKYIRKYIGGRMVNSAILLNEMSPETKWSDPDNLLIFGVGCLVGTLAPGACRVSIDTKSPYSNGKGSANFGGHFGSELKYAGFDHIVIKGRSEKPVYLWINGSHAELKDATPIWGKTTFEAEESLRDELRDDRIQVASIGVAGENKVRGSIVFTNPGKAAAGSGVGCVMGDKKLKAVVVRGQQPVRVAAPERFIQAIDRIMAKIKSCPSTRGFRKGIIEFGYLPESPLWDVYSSARNGQDDFWPLAKKIRLMNKESGVPSFKKRMMSCFACPVGCMPFYEIQTGRYAGTKGIGYWINSATYSTKLDMDDPAASLRFHLMCNQLGLDGDMCSTSLAWAFECFERGLLTVKETDGLELKWGDGGTILKLQEKLAHRDGIGDFLADGVKESSRKLGKGSEEIAIHMKGQDSVDNYRVIKGWGLGVSTSPVGGRHLRGAVTGRPEAMGARGFRWESTGYDNVPEAVFWQARTKEIEDALGLCVYVGTWVGIPVLEVAEYAELISSATGMHLTEEGLMKIARVGINLEKAFNTIHAGFDRKDDYPPRRYMKEAVRSGPFAGNICDREKWDEMLNRYYELQGWDPEMGLQTSRCLGELEMDDVAEKLNKLGKLKK
ncbi:MAG: aldehyde ferredoxin oxidoreductase C-terminal domain-containing protein, partial [Thermodesulfobacteriota bacterium]|nr:aldehyde ferredoxin oxidoreductase C-terminal domain-containing protein [Thermodesulfobacteriota bacterium]